LGLERKPEVSGEEELDEKNESEEPNRRIWQVSSWFRKWKKDYRKNCNLNIRKRVMKIKRSNRKLRGPNRGTRREKKSVKNQSSVSGAEAGRLN